MSDRPSLYHVTPLHYLPHILRDGALYAQSVLAGREGIAPRVTAKRRDRMLGLADSVHLSLHPDTPLLADKIAKGYPHALLVFDRAVVLGLPQVALLPYNTKAWHTRAVFAPVTDWDGMERMLRLHRDTRRYPSLEVLVKYGLELTALERIAFPADDEREAIEALMLALRIPVPMPLMTDAALFPGMDHYRPTTRGAVTAYFSECARAGALLPPPELPFD